MRCLWITRQDPRPADSGELIYTLGLLESLAALPGMEITVLAHEAARPGDGGPPPRPPATAPTSAGAATAAPACST